MTKSQIYRPVFSSFIYSATKTKRERNNPMETTPMAQLDWPLVSHKIEWKEKLERLDFEKTP